MNNPEREIMKQELVHETFKRITGVKWPGGDSEFIINLLVVLDIKETPGSYEANVRLQEFLLNYEKVKKFLADYF